VINFFDILGVIGSFIIAFEYFYSQYRHTFLNSVSFFVGNIFGSFLILLSLIFSSFNIGSFCIESLWILVSIYGLFKYQINKKENSIFIGSYRQNEFSVDGFPSKIEKREFTKDDLGMEILFKNNNEIIPEKSGFLNMFLLNGTAIFTPSAISNNTLNVNDLDRIKYSGRFSLKTIHLMENKEYSKEEIQTQMGNIENNCFLFIETGFMEKNISLVEKGIPKSTFFSAEKPSLSEDAAKYLGSLENIIGIMIDSISFECESSRNKGMTNTYALMNIDGEYFKPLVYHVKTPDKDYDYVSIRMGNVPSGIIPSYPVEVVFLS